MNDADEKVRAQVAWLTAALMCSSYTKALEKIRDAALEWLDGASDADCRDGRFVANAAMSALAEFEREFPDTDWRRHLDDVRAQRKAGVR